MTLFFSFSCVTLHRKRAVAFATFHYGDLRWDRNESERVNPRDATISEEESDHYRTFAARFLWYIKPSSFWHTFSSQQKSVRMMSNCCCRSMLNSMTQASVSLSRSRREDSSMPSSENHRNGCFGMVFDLTIILCKDCQLSCRDGHSIAYKINVATAHIIAISVIV